ncbi:MAG: hypothetical protein AUI14_13015 [Actinobacteria bacterium 13_2_20CM_2_71_6]|nr:MAG: hypothetical protein AUI14_13015 [Actinobacteria bacterium 13_2_20CM_2_71_6]
MARRSIEVVLWAVALAALLLAAQVRGILGGTLQLTLGLLLVCGGIGFVLAPLLRRRAGRGRQGELRRRSFVIGLVVTVAGLVVTGVGLWHLVHEVGAHGVRTLAS